MKTNWVTAIWWMGGVMAMVTCYADVKAPLSLAPVSDQSSAGMVELKWAITYESDAKMVGPIPYGRGRLSRWWLSGEEAGVEVAAFSLASSKERPGALPTQRKLSGEATSFLVNVPVKPVNIQMIGVRLSLAGTELEMILKLNPEEASNQTVEQGRVVHFGVYDIHVELAKSELPKGTKAKEAHVALAANPILQSGGVEQVMKDVTGQQVWKIKGAMKRVRAGGPEDLRRGLDQMKLFAQKPGSPIKLWMPQLDRM